MHLHVKRGRLCFAGLGFSGFTSVEVVGSNSCLYISHASLYPFQNDPTVEDNAMEAECVKMGLRFGIIETQEELDALIEAASQCRRHEYICTHVHAVDMQILLLYPACGMSSIVGASPVTIASDPSGLAAGGYDPAKPCNFMDPEIMDLVAVDSGESCVASDSSIAEKRPKFVCKKDVPCSKCPRGPHAQVLKS